MPPCKIALSSLGCAKNQVDAEYILGALAQNGFSITADVALADVIIVNTCAFIEDARKETIDEIFRLAEYKKTGACRMLVATGCFAQRYGKTAALDFPEVDAFVGLGEAARIPRIIADFLAHAAPENLAQEHPRTHVKHSYAAYVKISDGCDNRCTYCAIPLIRGNYRSFDADAIIAEALMLQEKGVKELVLIGQDTTLYGVPENKPDIVQLIKALLHKTSFPWIRLMYTHPAHWSTGLMEFFAGEERLCKYIDLPLQHIADPVLSRMGRKVDARQIRELITMLRKNIPNLTLRTSLITGFPGETDRDFLELFNFVRETEFERLGVFAYSREEGTPAYDMKPQVPAKTAQKRLEQLMALQRRIMKKKNKEKINTRIRVLVESATDDPEKYAYMGRSQADAPEVDGQVFISGKAPTLGSVVSVQVKRADEYDLYGQFVI